MGCCVSRAPEGAYEIAPPSLGLSGEEVLASALLWAAGQGQWKLAWDGSGASVEGGYDPEE